MERRLVTDEVPAFGITTAGAHPAGIAALVRRHAFIAVLALVNLFFSLANIGNAHLSIGEGNTALLGKNVLSFGFPKAWDGSYLAVPFYDSTINQHLAWVAQPWLQYYLAAAGIALFGPTNLGARFFFAISGVVAVIAVYYLALRLSDSKRLAQLSALILALHPVFWLYSRQSRYYAPTMLLLVLALLTYFKWREQPTKKGIALFVVTCVALFYSLYTPWAFIMLGIGLHYLLFARSRETFPAFALAAVLIAALTLPWFLYAPPGFYYDLPPTYEGYWNRVVVHLWKIQTLYYPFLTLLVVWGALALAGRATKTQTGPSRVALSRNALPLLGIVAYVFFVLVYPFYTTHYMLPVIPFGAIITAFLILKIRERSSWVATPIFALLLVTNSLHVLPFAAVEKLGIAPAAVEALMPNPTATMTRGTPLSHYLTEQLTLRSYAFDSLSFITHERQHQLKGVVEYLREHARPGDTVFVPWNDANAVAFYTGLNVTYNMDTTYFRNARVKEILSAQRKPDWIVPLSFDVPPNFYLSDEFRRDYEMIKLHSPKEYFETYPNIEFFNFRTNDKAPSWFYILKGKRD